MSLLLLLTFSLQAQFPVANTGCFTYQYVPTKVDTITEIMPAVVMVVPAVYKDTIIKKVCSPEYVEQYIDCSNGTIKICNRTIPANIVNICTHILVSPSYEVIVKPSYVVKCISNVRPGYVMQVPCK